METIAGENTSGEHLRPCDVFDVIGGVGIGGYVQAFIDPVR